MESRLPKPKAAFSKSAIETIKSYAESSKMNNLTSNIPDPTTLSTNNDLRSIVKSKSTLNINVKPSNENKPPSKPLLTRSQTSVSITRPVQTKVAVKRLGAATNAIEAKRANISSIVKSTFTQRPGRAGISSSTTATTTAATTTTTRGKAVGTVTGGIKLAPKPSKWDLKGRFELCNAELSSLREKHKKCAQFEKIVDDLRSRETSKDSRIEELENISTTHEKQLEEIKKNYADILQNHEDLKKKFELSEQSRDEISKALRASEISCNSKDILIKEHSLIVENFEKTVKEQKSENYELSEKNKDLQKLVHDMDRDRRYLHNAIQELKGNIRVFCRVRPRITRETTKLRCSINFIDESTMEISRADFTDSTTNCGVKSRVNKQEFSFDKIFPPTASQSQVFEELSMLVQSALEGYNVCVFAYGQTGSGKTYTMEGGESQETEGMIPRTVRHIFHEMRQFELLGWEYKIEASFLEIYNEHIVDLLDSQQKHHEIRMADSKGNDLYVTNLTVAEINSPEELHVYLRTAQQNRAVAATLANERSSRSHSVARIRLIGVHAEKDERSIGNLNLVDLAGSERLKSEEAVRTTETKNINKSLANLGNVILALLKKQDHIPYRNSKLTHLLMPSLGGNSKTLMLLNVSPLDECFNETLNSLRFASNVNSCKTGNIKRSRTLINNPM